ncbi:hypothetical protein AB6A40_005400 [Gnathostoma spinigerum]|uniref:EMC1 first beta-propeller domain-containing protein n=1 Tax=Gnathostoma spinigerum TaxID=75299 RepID=A0ABD6EHJ7_9BILA
MCVIVFFFSFLCSSFAIFEDQVGKFDWRQQYVGCPRHVWFDYVKPSKSERIYLSTEADVLAALSPNTGSIVWRQVQESFRQAPAFLVRGKVLISVSNSSAVLRAWDRHSGMLQWESLLGTSPSNSFRQMDSSDARVFVLSDSELSAVSITSGQRLWLTSFSDKS